MSSETAARLEETYTSVNGLRTRYMLRGSGPPLVLVHGFGEFLEVWLYNIEALSRHFTVYALDLPGHGQSDKTGQAYTISFVTDFLGSFLDTLGIGRTDLVGHSLGGVVCITLALEAPGWVNRLVLEDSGGFTRDAPLIYRLATLPVLGDIMLRPTVKAAIKGGLRRRFYNPDVVIDEWVEVAYQYLKMPKVKDTLLNIVRSNARLNGVYPEAVLTDRLHELKLPTLLIHGADDTIIPVEHTRYAGSLIPDAELRVIAECGHNPHLEKPAEFNEAVLAFLTRGRSLSHNMASA